MNSDALIYATLALIIGGGYGLYARYQRLKKQARISQYRAENQDVLNTIAEISKKELNLKPKVEEYAKVRKRVLDLVNSNKSDPK